MEIYITKALAALVLPPGGNIVLALLGLALLIRSRALGVALLVASLTSLYALSMPIVADALSGRLETLSPYPLQAEGVTQAGAIVVLGGGRTDFAPEYGGQTVSREGLERVRYAARVQERTLLPILVSGGTFSTGDIDDAALMKSVLEEDFGARVKWTERRSRTTEENARYTAQILKKEGIDTVILISHAAHLPRAVSAFERHGFRVIPAPTAYRRRASPTLTVLEYVPNADALDESASVLHEWLGDVWYGWRYR